MKYNSIKILKGQLTIIFAKNNGTISIIKISNSNIEHEDAWEIGSGINYSINELFEMFKKRFNVTSVSIEDQPGNYRKTLRTNDDMLNKLNWTPSDRLNEYIQNLN